MPIADDLIERGNRLFGSRGTLMQLWQEIGDNFYVQRSDFTSKRYLGDEFADHLTTSYPLIVHRELSNAFSGMLRPTNLEWFRVGVEDERGLTLTDRKWMEMATKRMRKVMYDRHTQFVRATKEADADFAAFGQAVISYEIDWKRPGFLYRCWHLRDVAWDDAPDGTVGEVHRKWTPTIRELKNMYRSTQLHETVNSTTTRDEHRKLKCRVVTIPAEQYPDRKFLQPWVRCVIDAENSKVMEVTGQWDVGYVIPRWQTVSGSQYAYSPATICGLPDARLVQAVTLTLLEAGEIAVRPPLVATGDAIRSDMNYYAGGITIADADYDERLGDVLKPITHSNSGMPYGIEIQQDIRGMLATAFYLNKLTLPPANSKEMTAYETQERIQEYIREALPLFEPMEIEYNGVLCEGTFDLMMRAGAFGRPEQMPQGLRGQKVHFQFESPLHDAIERKLGGTFLETKEMIMHAIELDPATATIVDASKAFRDAMKGMGTPAEWLRTQDEANKMAAQMVAEQQEAKDAQQLQLEGQAARDAAEGMQALGQSG